MEDSFNGMNVDANRVCGRCLARLRKASGLTQVELAAKLQVPQSFVSKVETGERSLRVYEQYKYAQALDMDIVDFVHEVGNDLKSFGCF